MNRASVFVSTASVCLVCVALGAWTHPAEAQLLSRASSAARGTDRDDSSSSQRDDDHDWSSNDRDDDDGGSVLGRASSAARDDDDGDYDWGGGSSATGAGVARRGGFGTIPGGGSGSPDGWVALGGCPYEDDNPGYGVETRAGEWGRTTARLTLEGGYVLAGAGRVGVSARAQLPWLLDFTTRYSLFLEPVDNGVIALALGRIGADIRIVQLPSLQLRVGGGLRHLQDGMGAVMGGDFAIGLDVFLGDPVVISVELTGGVVGEAGVLGARATLGAMVDSLELFIGYDYQGLFGAEHVDLGGPMAGIRLWL